MQGANRFSIMFEQKKIRKAKLWFSWKHFEKLEWKLNDLISKKLYYAEVKLSWI